MGIYLHSLFKSLNQTHQTDLISVNLTYYVAFPLSLQMQQIRIDTNEDPSLLFDVDVEQRKEARISVPLLSPIGQSSVMFKRPTMWTTFSSADRRGIPQRISMALPTNLQPKQPNLRNVSKS